jgi:hypothetical protein
MENYKKHNQYALEKETTETKVEILTLEQIEEQLAQATASLENLQQVISYWQNMKDKALEFNIIKKEVLE